MKNEDLFNKVEYVLERICARVALKSPYYEMVKELQQDMYLHKHREEIANKMLAEGKTIREIAAFLGYKNPGSVSCLIKKEIK